MARRERFESNKDVITKKESYFEELLKYYILDGLKKLEKRWVKCIELQIDYVEKQK